MLTTLDTLHTTKVAATLTTVDALDKIRKAPWSTNEPFTGAFICRKLEDRRRVKVSLTSSCENINA